MTSVHEISIEPVIEDLMIILSVPGVICPDRIPRY
jgi:hypothetical protein